ncbi:type VII secretion protein EccCa [Dactylosporangium sp. AC04546]|uniref:type VII secretion protein EccCa n=1 Tax=Dactylosporangium sp. AC04546 TaxID=2862460 RepID=UPI001EE026A0|nr:type VII secretion protein EccCa [Dactylosporangium sp. AC04546]WVK89093.1 type VII secretion protein EccCa [Dactylosporangium sp. AC04546]
MGTTVVKRPARRPGPRMPSGELVLDPPPELPPPGNRAWMTILMTLPMLAGSAAMALMFSFTRPGPIGYLTGAVFGVSMLGMFLVQVVTQGGQQGKAQMAEARRQYMRHLSRHRRTVRETIVAQRRAMFHRHPDPEALWSTVHSHRLWERRGSDADFGLVRVGIGPLECATPVVPPETRPVEDLEPTTALALRRFVKTYSVVPGLPIALALRGFSRVHLRGEPQRCRGAARAMIAQLATFHAPEDILVAICCGPDAEAEWQWAKWLPHAMHPVKLDALGQLRLVSGQVTALEAMLDDVLAARPRFNPEMPALEGTHVVVVVDGGDTDGSDHVLTDGGIEGVTLVDLSTPPKRLLDRSTLVLELGDDGELHSATADGRERIGRFDELGLAETEALARSLAPRRLSAIARGETPLASAIGLTDLLGLGSPHEFDPAEVWGRRPNRDRLRVTIGVGPDGEPVELDLKESALDGMGPHGLLVGATGSGKSELLRTLVLALSMTHSSETLNFILVDYKGGATFARLDQLPHTSAVITNLSDEVALVDRMHDAISGELIRRQELLRHAGNFNSQRDYERARAAGAALLALPSLVVIVDEFSELLTAKPDLVDMFVQIGRVGRSLGVHLLLASQRLEEGRLRGLDTHLSYRVALRTLSPAESRSVIGAVDAYELPRAPGHGFLTAGSDDMVRFRAAYVSGAFRSATAEAGRLDGVADPVMVYGTQYVSPAVADPAAAGPSSPAAAEPASERDGESELGILIGRLAGQGPPAHRVWLPPLDAPPTLDGLLPPVGVDARRGLTAGGPGLAGGLRVAVGIVDRPFEQRRDPLWLDLSGAAGHCSVTGAPQTGKSTLLRTLVTGLALTHTPQEVQFYCLDLSGGLVGLRDLPHVGVVASRREPDRVRRAVGELVGVLRAREERFARLGIDSMATYRRQRQAGQHRDDPFGDVFLVVDGWATVRNEFDQLEPVVTDLAARGLAFGVHVVLSAGRPTEVRSALRDLIGSRLELRLGEPADSMVNRRVAINVPEGAPGRGLTADGHHFLGALPRVDGKDDPATSAEALAELVATAGDGWPGRRAPEVRLLPAIVRHAELPAPPRTGAAVPIGRAESDLGPVLLDFDAEPNLLVFGDVEAGKSALLRTIAHGLTQRFTPDEARIVLLDHRRSLLGAVPDSHLLAYGTSAAASTGIVKDVAEAMQARLPGPDVTAEQLRQRSWWRGPRLFLLVDDHDLVASGTPAPLAPIVDLVAQGRDVGLHLVVTRRSGGASRALYDPLLARLRETSTAGLLLSGSRDEGALIGSVRPQPLPPGRGMLVTRRGGSQLVQIAWTDPPA